ncbi:MAG: glycoside hydrolase domain-containing protein [Planctomycetota bacterium]|jgi:hypothetical protein
MLNLQETCRQKVNQFTIILITLILTGCNGTSVGGDVCEGDSNKIARSVPKQKCRQSIPRTVASWDLKLGNHRARVKIEQAAQAVWVHIPWRRCDNEPAKKGIIVKYGPTGEEVKNVFTAKVNNEFGDIVFEPEMGSGEYHIYYLPIVEDSGWLSHSKYREPQKTAQSEWLNNNGLNPEKIKVGQLEKLPKARLVDLQSISEWDEYGPMEIIATRTEVRKLVSEHSTKKYLLFPEDRRYPIRLSRYLPLRWIQKGVSDKFSGTACRNEFYTFQLGVFAARAPVYDVEVEFESLKPVSFSAKPIPATAMQCFNLEGTDWLGQSFTRAFSVDKGKVRALWFGVQIPSDAKPGQYIGAVTVKPMGQEPTRVNLDLTVEDRLLEDSGDSEPWRHSRLRWLNSRIGSENTPTKGFEPLKVSGNSVSCFGRKVSLGDDGFVSGIKSYFSSSVTKLVDGGREILDEPVRFIVLDSNGETVQWCDVEKIRFTEKTDGKVAWVSKSRNDRLTLQLEGLMEFDGFIEYKLTLSAQRAVEVKDVYLEIPQRSDAARYMMGMGHKGGVRPAKHIWKWDQKNRQESVWLGDINAGLRCQLKSENYERPFVNIYYHYKPLNLPPAWNNNGKGGVLIEQRDGNQVALRAYGGSRTIQPGRPLHFDFTLLVTPFKKIDTKTHWGNRFHHKPGNLKEPEKIKQMGVNIINVHQGNICNPYINYPFLTIDELREYINKVHAEDIRVKLYYTVRELSNHAVELDALRSFGDEILTVGKDRPGNTWLQEHLVDNYLSAWYEKHTKDASIITSGMSRWHNYYLEGLDWLAKNTGINGLYLDGVAYDRDIMKRVRRILERNDSASLIDLHTWDSSKFAAAGCESAANLYMEHLPYIDRLWFGECFSYDKLSSDFWLIEISGIPFGLMGEMLHAGGNPWCGMVYGMTGRLGWGGKPGEIWKFWDEFGMEDTEMIGYWDPACPVTTDQKDVHATVYRKKDKMLIALASWAGIKVDVNLKLKDKSLLVNPDKAVLVAPEIKGFQPAVEIKLSESIPVESRKGWLLILDGIK